MARLGAGSAAESALPGGSAALQVRRTGHRQSAGLGSVVFGALELPTCSGSGCKAHDRSSATAELKNGPILFDVGGGHTALAGLIHRVLF